MTDRRTKAMDENLSFESFLGDFSKNLVNLPLDSIDGAIESSIKSLVEFFDADLAVFDKMGLKSLLILPLKIDDVVQFGFSLSTVEKHHQWSQQTIRQIKIVASILANLIQRKITLKQIQEEKEWSEAVIQGMPQLTYVMNLEGRLKRWNKNYQDLIGYSAEELQDKFLGDFLSDEDQKKVMVEIQKVIEDGQERSVEYDIIIKGGWTFPKPVAVD